MACTYSSACGDFMALQAGTLAIEKRFLLGSHVRECRECKLLLLILLDEAERNDRQQPRDVRALAIQADVDASRTIDWLICMFSTQEVRGAR